MFNLNKLFTFVLSEIWFRQRWTSAFFIAKPSVVVSTLFFTWNLRFHWNITLRLRCLARSTHSPSSAPTDEPSRHCQYWNTCFKCDCTIKHCFAQVIFNWKFSVSHRQLCGVTHTVWVAMLAVSSFYMPFHQINVNEVYAPPPACRLEVFNHWRHQLRIELSNLLLPISATCGRATQRLRRQ